MSNRLAHSQSLYLRKHAENPIDWWPWCDEAIATAQQNNKPIFLSIGYSSCHWCTVMEGEAFSDQSIATYMNENFLPIKVDREERPEIDSIYMQALQMMTGQGGWPLNIFLTPEDLVPFYGGTYFPVEPRYGRPGFLELLQAVRRFYDIEKTKLQTFKEDMSNSLKQSTIIPKSEKFADDLWRKGVEASTGIIGRTGYGNSFPMMPYSELALRGMRFNLDLHYDSREICNHRGLDLALGGIYDHVAGGFHRYTVDPTWTVPHFEKMLYDNGQILEYLANLWSTGLTEPAFAAAINGTVTWLTREMTDPKSGYFYAAQDADSFANTIDKEPEEGAFYVWSYHDLQNLLTDGELLAIERSFTVSPAGNFEGKNVLQRREFGELNDEVKSALSKLFKVRYGDFPDAVQTFPPARNNQEAKSINWYGRIPAVTDTKMIVAWNGLMISGLARAAAVFSQIDYLAIAIKAAKFILDHQWLNDRLHRLNYDGKTAVLAQSEDYAQLIKALLDLQQASLCFSPNDLTQAGLMLPQFWLEKAVAVQEEFDDLLWSIEMGGYYNTAKDVGAELLMRERSYMDNATPSANGVAIANLIKLAVLTENLAYLDRAEQALLAFHNIMLETPQACPSLFSAFDYYRNHTLVQGDRQQIAELSQQYFPTVIYSIQTNLPPGAVGLVCQGLTCLEPATSIGQLLQQLQQTQIRGNG